MRDKSLKAMALLSFLPTRMQSMSSKTSAVPRLMASLAAFLLIEALPQVEPVAMAEASTEALTPLRSLSKNFADSSYFNLR